jgi:hypothetical protein
MATKTSLQKQEAAMANRAPAPAPKPAAPKPAVNTSIAKQEAAMAGRAPVSTPKNELTTTTTATTSKVTTSPADLQAKKDELAALITKIEGKVRANDEATTDTEVKGEAKTVRTPVLDSNGKVMGYTVTIYNADGSIASTTFEKATGASQEDNTKDTRDAYALLKETFRSYGLESLVPSIEGFMKRNLGPNEALIELRATPEYVARFKGNELRRDSGKNALSEAEYLAVEDAYDQTLRAYGQQDYFGIDRKVKQAKAAELIGSDISAVEFKDRIQLAVDRVQNADPMTKKVLKDFYPTLNEADLIGYFLNPKDNLPKLQEKVTASEIGAAARNLNLATDVAAATDLARYGVTQAQAREGYSAISGILPTASKLGNIYGETGVKYAQAEGEAEVFKGNQDAATKRKRLASMERAAFSGSAGTNQGSLTRSTQGKI